MHPSWCSHSLFEFLSSNIKSSNVDPVQNITIKRKNLLGTGRVRTTMYNTARMNFAAWVCVGFAVAFVIVVVAVVVIVNKYTTHTHNTQCTDKNRSEKQASNFWTSARIAAGWYPTKDLTLNNKITILSFIFAKFKMHKKNTNFSCYLLLFWHLFFFLFLYMLSIVYIDSYRPAFQTWYANRTEAWMQILFFMAILWCGGL